MYTVYFVYGMTRYMIGYRDCFGIFKTREEAKATLEAEKENWNCDRYFIEEREIDEEYYSELFDLD